MLRERRFPATGRRLRSAVVAVCAGAALAVPAAADAATTAVVDGNEIRISSGPEANTIELFYSIFNGELQISDPAGVTGTPTCPEDGGQLECPTTETTRGLVVETGDGPDQLQFTVAYARFVGPRFRVDFSGGGGDDTFAAIGTGRIEGGSGSDRLTGGSEGGDPGNTLLGGPGPDSLRDDQGNDTLKGGGGRDRLNGGDDRDRYFGGGGPDRVLARDFTQDLKINCGGGNDRLRRDPFDPPPRSC